MTPLERFEARYIPEPNSGCWLWTGGLSNEGYGRFWNNGRMHTAQRASYQMFCGPISDDLVVDHLCRVRCCVNPRHFEAITNKQNILRGASPVAVNKLKTHCIRGGMNLRRRISSGSNAPGVIASNAQWIITARAAAKIL